MDRMIREAEIFLVVDNLAVHSVLNLCKILCTTTRENTYGSDHH